MKKNLLPFLVALLLLAPVARLHADDNDGVKTRMSQRISQIDEMKKRGVVGENNRGLLEARDGSTSADSDLIDAENRDREKAYAYLAGKNSTTVDMVARARARQIAQASVSGVWIQDNSGAWKKK